MSAPVELSGKQHEKERLRLQTEFVYMQEWRASAPQACLD
jgi:hypothetical protein